MRHRPARPVALLRAAPRSARARAHAAAPSSRRTGRCPPPARDRRCARRARAARARGRAASRRRRRSSRPSRAAAAAPRCPWASASRATMSHRRELGVVEGRAVLDQLELGRAGADRGDEGRRRHRLRRQQDLHDAMKLPQSAKRSVASASPRATPAGSSPGATRSQLLAQQAPQQRDARVARAQVLGRVRGDRAPGSPAPRSRRESSRCSASRQLPPELAVHLRAHAADVAWLLDAAGDVDAKVGVVDRQHPADRLDGAAPAQARARHDAQASAPPPR